MHAGAFARTRHTCVPGLALNVGPNLVPGQVDRISCVRVVKNDKKYITKMNQHETC